MEDETQRSGMKAYVLLGEYVPGPSIQNTYWGMFSTLERAQAARPKVATWTYGPNGWVGEMVSGYIYRIITDEVDAFAREAGGTK